MTLSIAVLAAQALECSVANLAEHDVESAKLEEDADLPKVIISERRARGRALTNEYFLARKLAATIAKNRLDYVGSRDLASFLKNI